MLFSWHQIQLAFYHAWNRFFAKSFRYFFGVIMNQSGRLYFKKPESKFKKFSDPDTGNTRYEFDCQHGERECTINKWQNCAKVRLKVGKFSTGFSCTGNLYSGHLYIPLNTGPKSGAIPKMTKFWTPTRKIDFFIIFNLFSPIFIDLKVFRHIFKSTSPISLKLRYASVYSVGYARTSNFDRNGNRTEPNFSFSDRNRTESNPWNLNPETESEPNFSNVKLEIFFKFQVLRVKNHKNVTLPD